jgi:hypothetical protein
LTQDFASKDKDVGTQDFASNDKDVLTQRCCVME